MSDNRGILAVLLLGGLMFATNPDEASFRRYVSNGLKDEGAGWLERELTARAASVVYTRRDYKFLSIVTVPDQEMHFVGLLGFWIPFPANYRSFRTAFEEQ